MHFPTKMVELRVEDKDRASLAVVERIFTGLQLLGCLAPENDAVLRPAEKAAAPVPASSLPPPVQTTAAVPAPAPPVVLSPKPVATIVPGRGSFPKRQQDRSKPTVKPLALDPLGATTTAVTAPTVTTLPGARASDGAVGIWLEKKSASVLKGWQLRWCVFSVNEKAFLWFDQQEHEAQRQQGRQDAERVAAEVRALLRSRDGCPSARLKLLRGHVM